MCYVEIQGISFERPLVFESNILSVSNGFDRAMNNKTL